MMSLRVVPLYTFFMYCFFLLLIQTGSQINAQTFTRSVLPGNLDFPWEIIYGPDDMLWISESGGLVSRVDPNTGERTVIFQAADYYPGSPSETADCGANIGANTYGMALHQDFANEDSAWVYLFYSYNNGTSEEPQTLFKIARFKWDAQNEMVIDTMDVVTEISNGYDHWGGRMIAIKQNGTNYLYFSVGDHGSNNESCYDTPEDNPNNLAQDISTDNGKIHRIYMDGTIPEDNPIQGNSIFTRGHRNPQGLAYNPVQDVLYDIEHGHQTDDEINILIPGMNYGWKNVRGYHDGNIEGELEYIENYTPNPEIPGDSLIEAFYSWGTEFINSSNNNLWPTVAPSDGYYYQEGAISEWTNCLLVVTLKNGTGTDQELFRFRLTEDGRGLADSTEEDPNPKRFFAEDQNHNGRLRDLTFSPDGSKLFLITNNWNGNNPIIVYTYNEPNSVNGGENELPLGFYLSNNYPNPFNPETHISFSLPKPAQVKLEIFNLVGERVKLLVNEFRNAGTYNVAWNSKMDNGSKAPSGIYFYRLQTDEFNMSKKLVLLK